MPVNAVKHHFWEYYPRWYLLINATGHLGTEHFKQPVLQIKQKAPMPPTS